MKQLGWSPIRRGGRHDVWDRGEYEIVVPRHREINDLTAGPR